MRIIIECCCHEEKPKLSIQIREIHGGGKNHMSVQPGLKLLDTEKILLSVMPRKADGTIDISAVITWVSSAPSSVGVEPGTTPFDFDDGANGIVTCPGFFNCWALTPNDSGSGSITASAPGYESDVWPIAYSPGAASHLNGSVGQPVSDLPA